MPGAVSIERASCLAARSYHVIADIAAPDKQTNKVNARMNNAHVRVFGVQAMRLPASGRVMCGVTCDSIRGVWGGGGVSMEYSAT